jgi:hypothetical protein
MHKERSPQERNRMSNKSKGDDLEAVRSVVEALQGFDPAEQERIIRWAREKVGLGVAPQGVGGSLQQHSGTRGGDRESGAQFTSSGAATTNIKTFIDAKNPQSDRQFAAAVAYYYKFEASESERKSSITATDLQEACRKVGRERIGNPGQTLINAHSQGYLDKAGERGAYSVNTVGENLVAMTLPEGLGASRSNSKKKKETKKRTKSQKKSR